MELTDACGGSERAAGRVVEARQVCRRMKKVCLSVGKGMLFKFKP